MKIAILSRGASLYSKQRLVEAALELGHEPQVIDHTKCYVLLEQNNPDVFIP